ncbi:MAG: hypothetical protein ACW97W_05320 [Candidatus Hodarchaeales archaeon]
MDTHKINGFKGKNKKFRFKLSRRKLKTSQEEEESTSTKPVKPGRGWRRVLAIFKLYFPISVYQRALEWKLISVTPSTPNNVIENDNANNANETMENGKVIHIQEKSFRSRFGYFITRTILQSFGLSIVFTAPFSFPWIFNVVIPFSIDLLPLGLSDIIREFINTILVLLSPFKVIVDIITIISNIFGMYNPIFFYGSTLWILTMLGFADIEVFKAFNNTENLGTGSMLELLANHFQAKFGLIQSFVIPFLILVAGSISFFLVIRRARSILFELQTEREQSKNIEKIKRTLISYYFDEGYSKVEYTEKRIISSTKLVWLARITKYGPIVSVILPISLAFMFIIL